MMVVYLPATDQRSPEIDFLETAYNEGFAPFKLPVSDFGATSPGGRKGFLIVRGRDAWEVWLGNQDEKIAGASNLEAADGHPSPDLNPSATFPDSGRKFVPVSLIE